MNSLAKALLLGAAFTESFPVTPVSHPAAPPDAPVNASSDLSLTPVTIHYATSVNTSETVALVANTTASSEEQRHPLTSNRFGDTSDIPGGILQDILGTKGGDPELGPITTDEVLDNVLSALFGVAMLGGGAGVCLGLAYAGDAIERRVVEAHERLRLAMQHGAPAELSGVAGQLGL